MDTPKQTQSTMQLLATVFQQVALFLFSLQKWKTAMNQMQQLHALQLEQWKTLSNKTKKGVFYNFKDETGEIHTVYIRDPDKRDKTMPTLSNILFEADKRGAEICRTLAAENGQTVAPEKKQPKKEMCFQHSKLKTKADCPLLN